MNKQKRYKQIATGVVLLVALVVGLSQINLKSVDSYQKEQAEISEELGLSEDSNEVSAEGEIASATMDAETADSEELSASETSAEEGEKNQKEKKKDQTKDSSNDDKSETRKGKSKKEKGSSGKDSNQSKKKNSGKAKNGTSKNTQKDASEKDAGSDTQSTAPGDGSSAQTTVATPIPSQTEVSSSKDDSKNDKESESAKSTPVPTKETEKNKITCKVQIVCHTLVENKDDADSSILKYIPSNGILLAETTITVDEGTTAYEALSQICKAKNIALDAEYTPMYKNYYVKGIGHLYEKQAGDRSGWVFKINGKSTNKGASSFVLSEGDTMTWAYTCDGKTS